jgi:GrpB-like predicted nucleotidyltransferase (UPF0157 family)
MESTLGLSRGKVSLVSHDARWRELYKCEESDLRRRLGAWIVAVEHIGSTAVPGLDAKPILDLMIAVTSLQLPGAFFSELYDVGYEHRQLDTVPGRLFFAKGSEIARTHNLSVCETESPFWTSHIAFRDRLRSDERLARQYAFLKHQLAAQFPDDRCAYTRGKESFIRSVIAVAR